jgi:hypothetical protein
MRHRFMIALLGLLLAASVAMASTPVSPLDENTPIKPFDRQLQMDSSKVLGAPVDFDAALAAGAYYLRHAQADVTEDNAANGNPDVDPDDGGWDWSSTVFTHSASASPQNIYGATGQGLYYAYKAPFDATLFTALTDAANIMIATAAIRTSSDMEFLMNYDDLPAVSGTTYQDAARAKFDARIAAQGNATAFAQYLRDQRGVTQGYPNGIIGWDLGAYAVVAQMLDDRYPGNGYAAAADAIAEVLWQDSFNHNPGFFDIVADSGWDGSYTNVNYYWYNLGVSGLIDAFRASGTHTDEIPGLVARLLASQTSEGAVCGSYGVHAGDEDWQSTAYATLTLAALDRPLYQPDINRMAYYIGATQDPASGSWLYGSDHYPEVGGENTAAMSFGLAPSNVIVDDGFVDQAAVDVYNTAHATHFVLGYDAFSDIQLAIDAVSGSTVTVLPGTYVGNLNITLNGLILNGPNVGIAGNGVRGPEAILDGNNVTATIAVNANNVVIDGFTIKGGANGLNAGVWHGGSNSGTVIQNNIITDNCIGVFPQSNGPVLIKNNLIDANNRPGPAGGTGIYADNSNLLNIQGNEIRNHTTNSGVTFGATGPAAHLGLSFTNNSVHDNLSGIYCVSLSGAVFSGNIISSMPGGTGLTLSGACTGVDVLSNTFTGLLRGFRIVDHGYGYGNNVDAEAHQNNFSGCSEFALGVLSGYTAPLDASCNWWNDLGGPNAAPGNPNLSGQVIDQSGGSVVYWPWLGGMAPGGLCNQYGPNNVAVVAPSGCFTPTSTCKTFTVTFNRVDTTPLRAISVDFQLSPELVLCTGVPGTDVVAGGLWGAYAIQKQVVDNGGGSYTVDIAVLGDPCGPATGGAVFTVNVAKAPGVTVDAVGTVTVTDVLVRDCNNVPLPGIPGAPASITIDLTAPATATNLTAQQVKTGNDSDGTTKINLAWTDPVSLDADQVEIWRKGYGAYPEYDDAGGSVPVAPVSLANGWTLVVTQPVGAPAYVDEPATRDFYYYAAIVIDDCGNRSVASTFTGGTLNYHLGDVAPIPTGDNLVNTLDISRLGSHYGITLTPASDPYGDLDVGPTTDYSVDARPTTDNQIQFEDLIMFAINYGMVSKDALPNLTPAAQSAVIAKVGEVDPATSTFSVDIEMTGDGQIQGLSIPMTWNGDAVKPVGFTAGNLIADQGGLGMVLSPAPGTIDAAVFGERDLGICGQGTVATVTFQVVGAGDFGIDVGDIVARDRENQPVVISGSLAAPALVVPARTELYANTPNPFNPSTQLSFALSRQGSVRLQIYSVQGRLVATLIDGELPAGPHSVTWQGRDDAGRMVSSGAYIVRLEAPDATQSRRITLMK